MFSGLAAPEYSGVELSKAQVRASHDGAVAVIPYTNLDRAVIDDHTINKLR